MEEDYIVYTFDSAISLDALKKGEIKQITLELVNKNVPTTIVYDVHVIKPEEEGAEKKDDNESNVSAMQKYYRKTLEAGQEYYQKTLESGLAKKAISAYSSYLTQVEFVPVKIELRDRCFDDQNELKPCKDK